MNAILLKERAVIASWNPVNVYASAPAHINNKGTSGESKEAIGYELKDEPKAKEILFIYY